MKQLSTTDTRGMGILLDARLFDLNNQTDYLTLAANLKSIGLTAKQVKQLAPLFDLNKNDLYDKFQQDMIDTHAHLHLINRSLDDVLVASKHAGVDHIIEVAIDEPSIHKNLTLYKVFSNLNYRVYILFQ